MNTFFEKLSNNLTLIVTLIALVSSVTGALAFFAKATDLKQIEQRLDYKIKADRFDFVDQRLWKMQERGVKNLTPLEKEEMHRLELEKARLDKQLSTPPIEK
jgi:hypothetical protein